MRSSCTPSDGNAGLAQVPVALVQTWPFIQVTAAHLSGVEHMPVLPSQIWPAAQVTPVHLSVLQVPVAASQN